MIYKLTLKVIFFSKRNACNNYDLLFRPSFSLGGESFFLKSLKFHRNINVVRILPRQNSLEAENIEITLAVKAVPGNV